MADTTRVRVELMHGCVPNVEMAVYRTADDGGIRDEKMIWSGTYEELAAILEAQ